MPEKQMCEHCQHHTEPAKNEYWHYFKITLPANMFWLVMYILAFAFVAPYVSKWLHTLGLVW